MFRPQPWTALQPRSGGLCWARPHSLLWGGVLWGRVWDSLQGREVQKVCSVLFTNLSRNRSYLVTGITHGYLILGFSFLRGQAG